MKALFNFILSLATAALMVLFAALKINEIQYFFDPTPYRAYIDFAYNYAPIVLLCLFAFGGLIGKSIKIIFFIVLLIALAIFAIACFLPQWISGIFGIGAPAIEGALQMFF